jgi:hypothetical protein
MLLRTKILTAFLLLLSALPILYTVSCLVELQINESAIEEKLEHSSLQTILISNDKLVWLEKGREVLIKGKLFDVKSISIEKGNTTLTGFFDVEEEEILHNMFTMGGTDEESSPVCAILAHMLCPAILHKTIKTIPPEAFTLENASFPILQSTFHNNPCIGIITPPPNTTTHI